MSYVDAKREFFTIGDYNGDGKSDVIHQYLSGTNTHNIAIYYSNGTTFIRDYYSFNYDALYRPYMIADFNGDGIDDLIDTLSGNAGQLYITYINPLNQAFLLTKIKDGYQRLTEFQYKLFAEASGIYTYTPSAGYPLNIFVPKSFGVYKLIVPDGTGNVANTTFTQFAYGDALVHKEGKGFLGFKSFKTTDNLTTLTTETKNDIINANYTFNLFGSISSKTYYQSAPTSLLTETTPSYSIFDLGNKRFSLNTTQTKSKNYITDIEQENNITQNSDGNITQAITILKTASTQAINQTTTTNISLFSTNSPSTIPSLPGLVAVTNSYNGTSYTDETKYEYNNGLLKKMTSHNQMLLANPSPSVVTELEYDAIGNITKKTVTPLNPSGSSAFKYTRFEYKPNYKTINKIYSSGVSGEIMTAEVETYDKRFGMPTSIKNGIYTNYITSITYDAFGREKTSTQLPNNITSNTIYSWDNSITNSIIKIETTTTGAPTTASYIDRLGRSIKSTTDNYSGTISSTSVFDNMGRLLSTTAPDASNASTNLTSNYTYYPASSHFRLNSISNTIGTVSYEYALSGNLNKIKTNYPGGRFQESYTDPSGKLVKTVTNSGTVLNSYNAQGNPKQIDAAGTNTTMEYDAVTGQQTKLIEPNSGTTEYKYNGYGELIYQKDNKGFEWVLQYDVIGRIVQKTRKAYSNKPNTYPTTDADQITQYIYETATNGKEQLKYKKVNGVTAEEYAYDTWHRNNSITQYIDANTILATSCEFNTDNSVKSVTYPENVKFNYNYSAKGFLQSVKNSDNTLTVYQTTATNAYNAPIAYTLGNGKTTNITLLPTGQMSNTQTLLSGTTFIQKLNYTIPVIATGNITQRTDGTKATNTATDVFTYETQYDRLSSIVTNNNTSGIKVWTYDNNKNGNISTSTDLGNYTYHANKKHALTQTQLSCTQTGTPLSIQTIDYTASNQPARIIKPGTPNSYEMLFSYGVDDTRVKSELKLNGTTQTTRYYSGSYEKWISGSITKHIYYIYGGNGLCAIATKDNGNSSLNYYYTYTDHLGSIVKLTDQSGASVLEQNFDAWGRYRDPNNWSSYTATAPSGSFAWLRKGFTQHEHLPEFGLILMAQNNNGGRLYDPQSGRMLSPDPYVQNTSAPQAYNRYSYVLNNPLAYTDPTGYVRQASPTVDYIRGTDEGYSRGGGGGGYQGDINNITGNEAYSYNYMGPYSMYANNPAMYAFNYGTQTWMDKATHDAYVKSSLARMFGILNEPKMVAKKFHNNRTGSAGEQKYNKCNISIIFDSESSYDYMSTAVAGAGNMTYYTGSKTYTHIPKVYGNTNAYTNYIFHRKEGNFFGRLWYATKAGWNTMTPQEQEDMNGGAQALAAILPLKPLGLGNTGRIIANNLTEQLAMEEAMSNPKITDIIQAIKPVTDPRWYGWRKMQYIKQVLVNNKTVNIVIHYVAKIEDGVIIAVDDFKFK